MFFFFYKQKQLRDTFHNNLEYKSRAKQRLSAEKMLLCTSIIALFSLILISQSKATFLTKEIRV